MNKRLFYLFLVIASGFVLVVLAKYLPWKVFAGVFLTYILALLTRSMYFVRKKYRKYGPYSALQKASIGLMYASAVGTIIALFLIVMRIRHIGFPMLNYSLWLYIIGAFVGIASPLTPAETDSIPGTGTQLGVVRIIMYLCSISSVVGLLLRLNHFPWGKTLIFGGVVFMIITLVVYTAITKGAAQRGS